MRELIIDIETNGIDFDNMEVFMVAIGDLKGMTKVYLNVEEAIEELKKADRLIGHNIIAFDLAVLERVYGFKYGGRVFDTMLATQLVYRDMYWTDIKHKEWSQALPKKLLGSHSLEAWGYRLGVYKGDFGKHHNWELSADTIDEFIEYNKQDIKVTRALYTFIAPKVSKYSDPFKMETRVATILKSQMLHGFLFDEQKARELLGTLYEEQEELEHKFQELFPPKKRIVGYYVRPNSKRGIKAEDPKIVEVPFNPSSRQQVAAMLQEKYGWKPQVYSPTGQPKVSEEILATLPYDIIPDLIKYFKLGKYIGFLTKGEKGLLHHIGKDGRVHGHVNVLGAVTRRMSHNNPNVAQMPRDLRFRELFTVPPDKVLVGVDAAGLELRCLAHYLAPYDGGHYAKKILEGDIHTENQKAAGLKTRNQAKRFIYAFIYGAGSETLGSIAAGIADGTATRVYTTEELKRLGRQLRTRFMKNTPGLERLMEAVNRKATTGSIRLLDGVPIPIRYDRVTDDRYKALNYLLQGAGAILLKRALMIFMERIKGLDVHPVANVHDEWQLEADPKIAPILIDEADKALKAAGEYYGFRMPLEMDGAIGRNWAETH